MNKATRYGIITSNGRVLDYEALPVFTYENFRIIVKELLVQASCHCVNYYGLREDGGIRFIMTISNDEKNTIKTFSHHLPAGEPSSLPSLSTDCPVLQGFEREMSENLGIVWKDHPWPKPIRFAHDSPLGLHTMDYPFYRIDSEQLHEVGVGPIHAGVIEPGHFRFICNGEMVLHLEIQLGWQHRGVEALMLRKPTFLARTILAEQITGDTTIGHTLAFVQAIEGLAGISTSPQLNLCRSIALELERIAVHTGDLSAMCTDVAYQLGNAVYGALRTPVINFIQKWCGNRFGKGLIRVGGSHFDLTAELIDQLHDMLNDFERRFETISFRTFHLESVLNRFEDIGRVTKKQCQIIGTVGMAARMSGISRDIRNSHPFAGYTTFTIDPEVYQTGDVMARAQIRRGEVIKSIQYLRAFISKLHHLNLEPCEKPYKESEIRLIPNKMVVSLTEGWRGEIAHQALTDQNGVLRNYKIKDPSFHNWLALAMALRNLEISDFPINNKSFDLSYCGHDL